ncbi:hypothetical protein AB0L68_27505 [Streptomyces sp. NPDC052164]|uniref:hypothetical protein n=1 Tax=unclassified Streptomyces TaxID=2593676 RepID=UPI003444E2F5
MTIKVDKVDWNSRGLQVVRSEVALPPLENLSDAQQRGAHCVWCMAHLGADLVIDLGEQRVTPATGAAYTWFPRECLDAHECSGRRATP